MWYKLFEESHHGCITDSTHPHHNTTRPTTHHHTAHHHPSYRKTYSQNNPCIDISWATLEAPDTSEGIMCRKGKDNNWWIGAKYIEKGEYLTLDFKWGRDKMAAILQMAFSNVFRQWNHHILIQNSLKFVSNCPLEDSRHWFREWLGTDKPTFEELLRALQMISNATRVPNTINKYKR